MNRSGRPATWSTISGRSMRSCFSTSIRRRPWRWNLLSTALTREDFPVPRAPVSSALLAVRPSTNWRVFCSISAFWLSTPWRSESRMRWRFVTGWIKPWREVLRQRKAMPACQSTGRDAGGSSVSTRSRIASPRLISRSNSDIGTPLGPVFGVDSNVIARQVAGPHRGRRKPAVEHDANRDLAFRHYALSVLFTIRRGAAPVLRHQHLVEVQLDAADLQIAHAGVADRGEEPPQIRIGGEKRGFHQGRVRDRIGDARAFRLVTAFFHAHGDELGRAFAVAYDRLRESQRYLEDRLSQDRESGMTRVIDHRSAGSPCRHQDEAVVGGGIAVDADSVERLRGGIDEDALECALSNRSVSCDKCEQRRHVGADHHRALGDSGHGHVLRTDVRLPRPGLGNGIGRHDRL